MVELSAFFFCRLCSYSCSPYFFHILKNDTLTIVFEIHGPLCSYKLNIFYSQIYEYISWTSELNVDIRGKCENKDAYTLCVHMRIEVHNLILKLLRKPTEKLAYVLYMLSPNPVFFFLLLHVKCIM